MPLFFLVNIVPNSILKCLFTVVKRGKFWQEIGTCIQFEPRFKFDFNPIIWCVLYILLTLFSVILEEFPPGCKYSWHWSPVLSPESVNTG